MKLARVVAASTAVTTTRSRNAKVETLAEVFAELDGADEELVLTASAYLSGHLRQRRTGLGYRSVQALPDAAEVATLEVLEVHEEFDRIAALEGPGSGAARAKAVETLFSRATAEEQRWLRGAVVGEVRQGASESLVGSALAKATDIPLKTIQRAGMLAGSMTVIAPVALRDGIAGLDAIGLEAGRPVLPMLASSAPTVTEAMAKIDGPASVETKLDGIRLQAHRRDGAVHLATRSLEDITPRLPGIVALVESLPGGDLVLDGEAMVFDESGEAVAFQDTASATSRQQADPDSGVRAYFFDILHRDGVDLLDEPQSVRARALAEVVPEERRLEVLVTDDPEAAEAFARDAVASGHEGVVVKNPASPYAAGRRGAGWIKVKPVYTLDLVVLAVEWGSGRRKGWLSNIHLGARDPETGEFVMLGKTFKGMTDEMLAWQTERFTALATVEDPSAGYVVPVRPEQVVEIAFDGVQRSTRYPGGVALRFARVVRYRDDKRPDEIDTIEAVRRILAPADAETASG